MKIYSHENTRTVTFTAENERDIFNLGFLGARIKESKHYETEPPSHQLICPIDDVIALLIQK